MKTRTTFVSNSSSSSFVIKVNEPFENVLELAEYMIPKRQWKGIDEELIEKVRKLKHHTDRKIYSVSFKSCNYDTFIAKLGNHFLIETCHNHDWDLYDFHVKCPEEYEQQFGDDGFYELPYKLFFYNLDYDFYGRLATRAEAKAVKLKNSYCDICYTNLWISEASIKLLCLKCKTEHKLI